MCVCVCVCVCKCVCVCVSVRACVLLLLSWVLVFLGVFLNSFFVLFKFVQHTKHTVSEQIHAQLYQQRTELTKSTQINGLNRRYYEDMDQITRVDQQYGNIPEQSTSNMATYLIWPNQAKHSHSTTCCTLALFAARPVCMNTIICC